MRQVSPIRILLMCDNPIEREGTRLIIKQQPGMTMVGCTEVSQDALKALDVAADITLVDIDCESRELIDLPKIVEIAGRGRVIVLTNTEKQAVFRHIASLGAMGVVSKHQQVETLVNAIRKVHSGEIWFDRSMLAGLLRQIAQPVPQLSDVEAAQRIGSLTKREREVIQLLGQGLNTEALAARLCISETTVRHHLSSILDKLGVRDRFDLVFYAYRHGLAVPPNHTTPRSASHGDFRGQV